MFIQQLYTNCLAQAAYYVESDGEVLIIDPLREPEPYLELAKKRNAKIKFIFETHFHADFVSGHLDISKKSGGAIVYGPNAKPQYPAIIAKDEEVFSLGKIKFKVLHTPGHTIESSCILLFNEDEKPYCLFSGDTLFIGDVGRPDLLSGNLSKEELAGMLYESLTTKIKTLPDEVILYPGHGAGSACGKNLGKETVSTIGDQKRNNYALKEMSKEEFIKCVTSDLPTPPKYFFSDAKINIVGYDSYEAVIGKENKALSVSEVKDKMKNALVIDTRRPSAFVEGYIPGSLSIGLDGDYAVWAGSIIDIDTPLIIVSEDGKELESIIRLARIGFEKVIGYLKGGITQWIIEGEQTEKIKTVSSANIESLSPHILLDVRKPSEREKDRIADSIFISLIDLPKKLDTLDKMQNYLVYCAGGYRSVIAVSLMKKHGFHRVWNLEGGINKVKELTPLMITQD